MLPPGPREPAALQTVEWVVRPTALLRRAQARRGRSRLRVGPLEIVPDAREVRVHGHRVELSQKEYALLVKLASAPDRVFTREQLLRDVWGYPGYAATRTVESHASRVRCKLEAAGLLGWVVNAWGVGYKLRPANPASSDSASVKPSGASV